ncbi:MAG: hypothetical protein PHV68_01585 [Candidatus Gastranaerophilales bacterium]|nr:hypothetical protein [Candidatus Gastranaerophilales bacterium]
MIKKILAIIMVLFILAPPAFAGPAKKPKPSFWKSNRMNLFYQKKEYRGLTDKYKNFSIGVVEVKDERMSKFYRHKDKFFQTNLLPTLQLLIKEELEISGMFKNVELIYEPYNSENIKEMTAKIAQKYDVDMIIFANLTDFQVIRGISDMFAKELVKNNSPVSPATLNGMDLKFKIGGIFQLVFLPMNYVIWSDSLEREYLVFTPEGTLKSKEMEYIVQNLLSQVMTDMLYLISEDGKIIKSK